MAFRHQVVAQLAFVRVPLTSIEEASAATACGELGHELSQLALATLGSSDKLIGDGRGSEREVALARYLQQADRSRLGCLDAGVAKASINPNRVLELPPRGELDVHSEVSTALLDRALLRVQSRTDVSKWELRRNPTLRKVGVHYVYLSWNATGATLRVRNSPAIQAVMPESPDEIVNGGDLLAILAKLTEGNGTSQLNAFVARLIDNELLVHESPFTDRRDDTITNYCAELRALGHDVGLAAVESLSRDPGTLANFLIEDASARTNFTSAASEWATLPDSDRPTLWVELNSPISVDKASIAAINYALGQLAALFPAPEPQEDLKGAIWSRYGNSAIPLLDLTDPVCGLLSTLEQAPVPKPGRSEQKNKATNVTATPAAALRAFTSWLEIGELCDIAGWAPPHGQATTWAHAALLENLDGAYSAILLGGYSHLPRRLWARFSLAGLAPELKETRVKIWDVAVSVTPEGELACWDKEGRRLWHPELLHSPPGCGTQILTSLLDRLIDRTSVAWDWGALRVMTHLPRIVCRDVVIAPERWLLNRVSIELILNARDAAAALRDALPGIARRRWLGVEREEGMLVVDSFSSLSARAALAAMKGHRDISMIELPQLANPPARSGNGRHSAEVLIFASPIGDQQELRPPISSGDPSASRLSVSFHYVCSPYGSDETIRLVRMCADRLLLDRRISGWHFDRVVESEHAIRFTCDVVDTPTRPRVVATMDHLGSDLLVLGCASDVLMSNERITSVGRSYYDDPTITSALRFADSLDVSTFLAENPDDNRRLARCTRDALLWAERVVGNRLVLRSLFSQASLKAAHDLGHRSNELATAARTQWKLIASQLAAGSDLDASLAEQLRQYGAAHPRRHVQSFISVFHQHCRRVFFANVSWWEWLTYEMAARASHEKVHFKV